MSRNLAAPSACPADPRAALARKGPDGERKRLLDHVEGCEDCLAAIATNRRRPVARAREGELDGAHEPGAFVAVGDVIAEKYRVEGLIGSGAMGSVYRAQHLALGSTVAIKVLRSERLHDATAARRFSREARATSSLRSPHAIRTFDIDRLANGVPYIVMEYLDGSDLAATVNARGPLPLAEALEHVIGACDAVGEAHGLEIIHRDLKPANLFLTKAGVIKVLDFGLAKSLPQLSADAGSEATKTNILLGSPHYMSPEQLRSAKEVDARADIWSLGATLFTLLSGEPPFVGANLYALIGLIMNSDAPLLTTRLPFAPPALAAVLAKCLRRDREERYPSCAALRRALEDVHASLHTSDRLPTRQFDAHAAEAAQRRADVTPGSDAPQAPVSARGEFAATGDEMYEPTMLAVSAAWGPPSEPASNPPVAPSLPRSTDRQAGVADSTSKQSAPVPDAIPNLFEDEPPHEHDAAGGEQAGTMVMPRLDSLPSGAAGGVPRVYPDDHELLPEMTKVMLEAPPHLRPPSIPAPAAWNVTAPVPPQVLAPRPSLGRVAPRELSLPSAGTPAKADHVSRFRVVVLLVGLLLFVVLLAVAALLRARSLG